MEKRTAVRTLQEVSTELEEIRHQAVELARRLKQLALEAEAHREDLESTPAQPLKDHLDQCKSAADLISGNLAIERVALEKLLIAAIGKPGGLDDQVRQLGWSYGGWINGQWVAYLMSGGEDSMILKDVRHHSAHELLNQIRKNTPKQMNSK